MKKKKRERKHQAGLQISLPISLYLKSPVSGLEVLKEKINVYGLPSGWTEQSTNNKLVVLNVCGKNTVKLVTVNQSLVLELYVDGQVIRTNDLEWACKIPSKASSIHDLLIVLNLLKRSHVCKGNELEEFTDVTNAESQYEVRMG